MKRKLAACILSLFVGTIITTNANAFFCKLFNDDVKATCDGYCNLIPDSSVKLKAAKLFCL